MKTYLRVVLVILTLYLGVSNVKAVDFNIHSKNAILYNLDENIILYEKSAYEKISIASMTKIMTAIVAMEHIRDLDEKITLTNEDFYGLEEANASVAGFEVGQHVTYRDLLYGLLLPSGADAAQALTRMVAGGRVNFINLMNEKAMDLGLKNTHFVNETGLDEEEHYSTVEEVAIIFQYALRNEELKKIMTSSSYKMSDNSFVVYNSIDKNKRRYGIEMDYLEGGKTGTTYDAGLCLASIATWNNVHYMLVTARAPYKEGPKNLYDAKTIYEHFMNHYGNQKIVEKKEKLLTLNTLYTKEDNVSFYADKTLEKYLSNDFEKKDLKYQYDGIKVITSKEQVGTKLGTLRIKYQDETVYEQDIILRKKLTFDIVKYVKAHMELAIGIMIICLIAMIFVIKKMRRRKKNGKKMDKIR